MLKSLHRILPLTLRASSVPVLQAASLSILPSVLVRTTGAEQKTASGFPELKELKLSMMQPQTVSIIPTTAHKVGRVLIPLSLGVAVTLALAACGTAPVARVDGHLRSDGNDGSDRINNGSDPRCLR